MDNTVVTALYTWYNFVPRNLYKQFQRRQNTYFLLISIMQVFGIFSEILRAGIYMCDIYDVEQLHCQSLLLLCLQSVSSISITNGQPTVLFALIPLLMITAFMDFKEDSNRKKVRLRFMRFCSH